MKIAISVFALWAVTAAEWAQNLQPAQSPAGAAQSPAPAQSPPPAPGATSSSAQTPQVVAGQTSPPSSAEPRQAYIRTLSAGLLGSYSIFSPLKDDPVSQGLGNALSVSGSGTDLSSLFGAGVAVNIALTDHYALNTSFILRWVKYNHTTAVAGTTTVDRTAVENTKANYIDIPVLVRRYNKSRYKKGIRWFPEVGLTGREVFNIETTTEITTLTGTTTNKDPIAPAHRFSYGATAGAGFEYIDDFGIHMVPEVRYTRWFSQAFNNLGIQTRKDQLEVTLSLTF